jgi:hypothetical protein
MTQKAKSLGVEPGWYANNCHCADHCSGTQCYKEDVQATLDYGFVSLKVDSCGGEKNFSRFAELFNSTKVPVLLENCHLGRATRAADGNVKCEMNLFRTSGDIRPTYGSILGE